MDSVIETSFRTLVGFVVLLGLTRFLGKKQLGQLTYFTYITGIAMGNIAGDMVVHRDINIADGIAGLLVWAVLAYVVEYISLKSTTFRVAFDGEPTIVIKEGKIEQKALSSHRLNMDDLSMLLRTNNVFSIKDVDYAILEPNGQLSILKKVECESVLRKDLSITSAVRKYLPTEIIADGKLLARNLQELNLDKKWIDHHLQINGYNSYEEVFFAEVQSDGTLHIERKLSY